MNYIKIGDGPVIHPQRQELHNEAVRLREEASEICGLTEGDIETRQALLNRARRIERIILSL